MTLYMTLYLTLYMTLYMTLHMTLYLTTSPEQQSVAMNSNQSNGCTIESNSLCS